MLQVDGRAAGLYACAGAHPATDVFFDNSPVMKVGPDAVAKGVKKIAWFSVAEPLRSGWAIGQDYLKDGVEMASAQVGQGTAYFFAPEMTFRAQPEGTFKFIFNQPFFLEMPATKK